MKMKKIKEIIEDITSWGTFPAILLTASLLLIGVLILVCAVAALGMTIGNYNVNAVSSNERFESSTSGFYTKTLQYTIITDKETGVKYLRCYPIGDERGATMTVLYNEKGEVLVGE